MVVIEANGHMTSGLLSISAVEMKKALVKKMASRNLLADETADKQGLR